MAFYGACSTSRKATPYVLLLFGLIFAGFSLPSWGAVPPSLASSPLASGVPLRVATRIVPPFVMENSGQYEGFSIDLWDELARKLNVVSKYQPHADVKSLLDSINDRKSDVGIAAISITSDRERSFDFSQPMFDSGLQILTRDQSRDSATGLWSVFLSPDLLKLLGVALLVVLIPAHLIWFVERNHPEGIVENKAYFPGILKAIWWSAGTLGAQADEMPRSWIGRVIAIFWMFSAIVFVADFTAVVTTSMTVQQLQGSIQGPDDLPGKRVATTEGSTSANYLRDERIKTRTFPRIDNAYEALTRNEVDAVVFDAPVLLYYANGEGKGKVQVVGSIFRKESYGIVFPTGSPLRKRVNEALLTLKEDGTYQQLYDKWFGKTP